MCIGNRSRRHRRHVLFRASKRRAEHSARRAAGRRWRASVDGTPIASDRRVTSFVRPDSDITVFQAAGRSTPGVHTDQVVRDLIDWGPCAEPFSTYGIHSFTSGTIDRLPVVPLDRTPPPIGTLSVGRSLWLDFSGVALRMRSVTTGRTPPLFDGFHGTHNPADSTGYTPDQEGLVKVGAPVSPESIPARYVINAGFTDPGLYPGAPVGAGTPPNPPYNDKVPTA